MQFGSLLLSNTSNNSVDAARRSTTYGSPSAAAAVAAAAVAAAADQSDEAPTAGCAAMPARGYVCSRGAAPVDVETMRAEVPAFADAYARQRAVFHGENQMGNGLFHSFILWSLVRALRPPLLIESGVLRGQTTWLLLEASKAWRPQLVRLDPMGHMAGITMPRRLERGCMRAWAHRVDTATTYAAVASFCACLWRLALALARGCRCAGGTVEPWSPPRSSSHSRNATARTELLGKHFIDFASVDWATKLAALGVNPKDALLVMDDHQDQLTRLKQVRAARPPPTLAPGVHPRIAPGEDHLCSPDLRPDSSHDSVPVRFRLS